MKNDIISREVLIKYLLDRGVIDDKEGYKVEYCKGGVSCITALVETPGKTMLVKQGRPKLAVKEEWLADPARIKTEVKATEVYNRYVPNAVPAVIFYDEESFIMVRYAAPADCKMWKTDLLNGIIDFEVAKRAVEALVTIHNKCYNDPEIAELFADDTIFYQLRISPLIEFVIGKHPELAGYGNSLIQRLKTNKHTLVHADYNPKNILIKADRNICILDYEIAHYGDPAFDLAFFANHIVLKSAYRRKWSAAILNMLLSMTDVYFEQMTYGDPKTVEAESIKILAMMMFARIDGKSTVEYITEEANKQLVRDMAMKLLTSGIKSYHEAAEIFLAMEKTLP